MNDSNETHSPSSTLSNVSDAHTFYNNPQERGLDERNESKIVHLLNINSWIKSTLIGKVFFRSIEQIYY